LEYFEILQAYQLSFLQWVAIIFSAFLLGMSKSEIKGIGIIIVMILAFVLAKKHQQVYSYPY